MIETPKKICTSNGAWQSQAFFSRKNISVFAVIAAAVFMFTGFGLPAQAASVGDVAGFNVNEHLDLTGRDKIQATLVQISPYFYFYVETGFWEAQTPSKKIEIVNNLSSLSSEFGSKIYPKLTAVYGFEWNPGIDGDSRITVLFESTGNSLGGYFRSNDEYSKLQVPDSNEREMLYLPIAQIDSLNLKVFLAHEFTHVIEFNQKDRLQGVSDETWLNEGRADFSSTIVGYDDVYDGSNLQRRVDDFLNQPNDSLIEFRNTKYDYASVNLFLHYLVDQYGISVLVDSLKSKSVGIASLNEALAKSNGHATFAQVFTDWTVAMAINTCSGGTRYCYLTKNLSSLKISPSLIFLPLAGDSSLSLNNNTKDWAGNWQKIIGGKGDLKLQFSGVEGLVYQVPYLTYDKSNNYALKFLVLDNKNKGEINLKDFDVNYNSLVILPSQQSKLSGSDTAGPMSPYKFTISVGGAQTEESALIKKLLDQIEALKKQLADLQGQNPSQDVSGCLPITANLYLGISGPSVSCLQEVLRNEGADIYPQGLVTGYFGSLTRSAVVRFQKKYAILQTGFVGPLTRAKINALLPNGG